MDNQQDDNLNLPELSPDNAQKIETSAAPVKKIETIKEVKETKEAADAIEAVSKEVAAKKGVVKKKGDKKAKRQVPVGKVAISATYNNTIITISDLNGNVLSWSSAGVNGFKGPKKSTPYAASVIVKDAVDKAKQYGLSDVVVYVKGVGAGRESAIRSLNANGLNVSTIKDITPIPHNGCRPKKVRRV
jgi:small subunit ribosomal protein S11